MMIEIIVTNAEEAKLAESLGANRLELIHDFADGGLTPKRSIIEKACDAVSIPVNIMLRTNPCPNFIYSNQDMENMLQELMFIKYNTKASGVVFGSLDQSGIINQKQLQMIIGNKGKLSLTFHRAIDVSANIMNSYTTLLSIPEVTLVLTSGGKDTAAQGTHTIQKMLSLNPKQQQATILAGSGINPDNILSLIKQAPVQQIHIGTGIRENGKISPNKFIQLLNNFTDNPSLLV